MILILIVISALAVGGAFLLGITRGKADIASLERRLAAQLSTIKRFEQDAIARAKRGMG